MVRQAGAGGNQAPDDHVLLQAAQAVAGAAHGGLGQHAGGLLERGRGDERLGRQRGLGNAQQDRLELRRQFALGFQPDVVLEHALARSEEHTSELQSLMRISYAVFCLKKTTKTQKLKSLTYTDIYSR